ncbi:MAG: hydrogenase iron-sulfur subunit [Armatimonadetes bacterium]|nr:hydrogenase iron-sulfur subunit [Armatimonadota bacterium]
MPAVGKENEGYVPEILVFSTNNVSDPGIDLAGGAHLPYSPAVKVISVPCSSGIRPQWVLYAIEKGFDGVFVAADGTDCAYRQDCVARTGKIVGEAQELLANHGHAPQRLKMAAICSVCAEQFTGYMKKFAEELQKLGPSRKGSL